MIYTAEQIRHKKKLKKGINFNLLVVGVNDLGKKTFINTLINQPYYQINQPIPNTSHSSIAGTSNSEFSENSSNNNEFSIETNSFGMCLFFFFFLSFCLSNKKNEFINSSSFLSNLVWSGW